MNPWGVVLALGFLAICLHLLAFILRPIVRALEMIALGIAHAARWRANAAVRRAVTAQTINDAAQRARSGRGPANDR